jgi:hypothetical protein
MMERLKSGLLIVSLVANALAIAFILILVNTTWLDIPLASYSHYKNCDRDFASVLKIADNVPVEERDTAKQAFSAIVCQKDFKTGQQIGPQNFDSILKQLENQANAQ